MSNNNHILTALEAANDSMKATLSMIRATKAHIFGSPETDIPTTDAQHPAPATLTSTKQPRPARIRLHNSKLTADYTSKSEDLEDL